MKISVTTASRSSLTIWLSHGVNITFRYYDDTTRKMIADAFSNMTIDDFIDMQHQVAKELA